MPFLLYGLVVVVAGVIAMITVTVVAIVLGAGAMMSGNLEGGLGAFVGLFIFLFAGAALLMVTVGPIAIGSIYAGFKDTLDDDDATVTNPAYR